MESDFEGTEWISSSNKRLAGQDSRYAGLRVRSDGADGAAEEMRGVEPRAFRAQLCFAALWSPVTTREEKGHGQAGSFGIPWASVRPSPKDGPTKASVSDRRSMCTSIAYPPHLI